MRTRHDEASVTVSLEGDLDLATVPLLRRAVMAELDTEAVTSLVLDLTGLTFLDSTGLGCWIELRNAAIQRGKTFGLEAIPPAALRTVTITGLAPLFGVAEVSPGTS